MTHSKVERIERILQLADNFKNKSDQSFQKSLLKEKEKQKIKKEDDELPEPADKKESFQEMLERLFFEEQFKK